MGQERYRDQGRATGKHVDNAREKRIHQRYRRVRPILWSDGEIC